MNREIRKMMFVLTVIILALLTEFSGIASLPLFHNSVAEAIIGRPLTPLSYAGVARRTTVRRASYVNLGGPVNRVGVR